MVIKVPLLKSGFLDMGPMFTELLQRALAVDETLSSRDIGTDQIIVK